VFILNLNLRISAVAPPGEICMTRGLTRARGDERLSANKRGETEDAAHDMRSKKPHSSEKNSRKQRSTDLGRALRTIYDDTLRESVPDDFANLLGKLN
jgi:hypothetical protein